MVTPVAKRQAVRHIQEALALSERRACALVVLPGVSRGMFLPERTMLPCASAYGNWRTNDAALAIAALVIFWRGKDSAPITRSCSAFTKRKG